MSKSISAVSALIPRKSSNTVARQNQNGTVVIICLDNDECFYTLDSVAAEFWNLIDGKKTVEQISDLLIKKHNPPLKDFQREVSRLISDLTKNGLIRS